MILSRINNARHRFTFKQGFKKHFGGLKNGESIANAYLKGITFQIGTDLEHLHSTLKWLSTAHDACQGKGVSAMFDIYKGWKNAYPETSGYIVNTFLTYSKLFNIPDYYKRALELGSWEIQIQRADGAIYSNMELKNVRVFNTAQVMLGWIELYEETRDKKYLKASIKAAEFLLKGQEEDGRWEKDTYCGARTYHSRVSWALLKLGIIISDNRFVNAAEKNTQWVLKQFNKNGWISNCGFDENPPITHVLDYTLRGLLEVYSITQNPKILNIIELSLESLAYASHGNYVKNIEGMLPASFNEKWIPDKRTSCLTGTAQFALLFYRYSQITKKTKYLNMADNLIEAVKSTQLTNTGITEIDGGIPGCFPFLTGYCQNTFPNWGAKFFADALMIKIFKDKEIIIKS